jgi:hypothetical protein
VDFLVPSVLFGVAVLAVILLVVLISAEARTKRQNAAKPKTATTESHPEILSEIETPETSPKLEAPETSPAAIVTTPPIAIDNQRSPLSHDQIQDLSQELRNVHQQVHQIEQKLGLLTTRVEYIEQISNGDTPHGLKSGGF